MHTHTGWLWFLLFGSSLSLFFEAIAGFKQDL